MTETALRRYTNLAAAINILYHKEITLLNPDKWDDVNDSIFLKKYMELKNAKSVLAICFAERNETFHHWKVFSPGMDGVCIHFNKEKLIKHFEHDTKCKFGQIKYELIKRVGKSEIKLEELPFMKRIPYEDEIEYRIVSISQSELPLKSYKIDIDCIEKISLSPWLPRTMADAVRWTLQDIEGCSEITITRSSATDNRSWKDRIFRALERSLVR